MRQFSVKSGSSEIQKTTFRNKSEVSGKSSKNIVRMLKGSLKVDQYQRNDVERKFRIRGKKNKSIIGRVTSGVEDMEHAVGGELHNTIGVGNNVLDLIFSDLRREKLDIVCENIKTFLDSPKTAGGAGCTPGAHQGGAYNDKKLKSFID